MPPLVCPNPLITEIAKGNGDVIVTVNVTWDGVSTPTGPGGCQGSIFNMRVRNASANTWYAKVPNAKGGVQTVTITPGLDQTFTAAQLSARGIDTVDEIRGIEVTDIQ